jgi:hypothetical protein
MHGFDVESKTFGISSSGTMTRPWSPVQVMQWSKLDYKKHRDLTREDDKLRGPSQKSAESYETRSFVQLGEKLTTRSHMRKGEEGRKLGRGGPRPIGPAHYTAQLPPPFYLVAIRAIYSPRVESHTSIHSSSATEEQRREGHHLGEERVKLVD